MSKALLHELGQSISFGRLSIRAKILWPMLLVASDGQGRGKADPKYVKCRVCPVVDEIQECDVTALLQEMVTQDMVLLYTDDQGRNLFQIVNWWRYHEKRSGSRSLLSPPPGWIDVKTGRKPSGRQHLRPSVAEWARLRRHVMARDKMKCRYCGAPAKHIDHVVPVCQGGTNDIDNLVAACATCNLTKSGRTPSQAGMELQHG